jgi:DMSO/TMAO reductase YedYZ molybdopterin-dependent catalytic subunit
MSCLSSEKNKGRGLATWAIGDKSDSKMDIDHPDKTSGNPHLKLETYKLTIEGEVEKPANFS